MVPLNAESETESERRPSQALGWKMEFGLLEIKSPQLADGSVKEREEKENGGGDKDGGGRQKWQLACK